LKIYKVGGAVRDELLGYKPRDHDFLVIDSSPEEMKKKGFIKVGLSYEVFLHPDTKEEYVLAGNLKEDLERRDLTINSMAKDQDEKIIDFFGGAKDLESRILRHTSHHFSDDPLRVYRVARFKAQYPDFSIANETLELCRSIAQKEMFQNLIGERILGELKDALVSARPENFFNVLHSIDVLQIHFACIRDWSGLNEISRHDPDPLLVFSFLVRKNSWEEIEILARRLMLQNDWIEAGRVASKVFSLPEFSSLKAEDFINLFYGIDAFRKPHLIELITRLFERKGELLAAYFESVGKISIKDVGEGISGKDIGESIKKLRIKKLEEIL
jgi:tRNA nucleotidyltransferase (CCA-adding enzyme)